MSTLSVSNITDGTTTVGTEYVVNGSAKAWVQHTDIAVNTASFGISSIVDDAVGINTLNFSNAFSGLRFATAGMAQTGSDRTVTASSPTTTSTVIETFDTAGLNAASTANSIMFGDLA